MIRELEADHDQIKTTQLLYSDNNDMGAQLFTICPDSHGEYEIRRCKPNEIILWLFNPDVSEITSILKDLYSNLKSYQFFKNQTEWVSYYISYLKNIYKKQSQIDNLMSQSFDVFFQSKNNYIHGHIPNTHNETLYFKENYYI